jgi:hypothetical protein
MKGSACVPGVAYASRLAPDTSRTADKTQIPIAIFLFKIKTLHTEENPTHLFIFYQKTT